MPPCELRYVAVVIVVTSISTYFATNKREIESNKKRKTPAIRREKSRSMGPQNETVGEKKAE